MTIQESAITGLLAGLCMEEQVMATRYMRAPKLWRETVYEFTRDAGYLHQYYLLRKNTYPLALGLGSAGVAEDKFDKLSHILIGRRGNQVVAGCRLTMSSPRKTVQLPMEDEGVALTEMLGDLSIAHKKYAELSGLVSSSFDMQDQYIQPLLRNVCRKLAAYNVEYLVGRVALSKAHVYRRNFNALGVKMTLNANMALPVGNDEEVKSYLMVVKLAPAAVSAREFDEIPHYLETGANE